MHILDKKRNQKAMASASNSKNQKLKTETQVKEQKKRNESEKSRNSSYRNKEQNKEGQQDQCLSLCKDQNEANPLARPNKKKNQGTLIILDFKKDIKLQIHQKCKVS